MEGRHNNPFDAQRCCICGGSLSEGHAVLFKDEQGNEARIDRACCDAITVLAKSTDSFELNGAINYARSKLPGAHPAARAKLQNYISRAQARLHPTAPARTAPRTAVRPETRNKSAGSGAEGFAQKALAILASIWSTIKTVSLAIFAILKRFFKEDPKRIKIGNYMVGLRTLVASGAALVILLLIIIIPGGGGGLVGKWELKGISMYGMEMNLSDWGMSGSMSMEFKGNGVLQMYGDESLFGDDMDTAKWSASGSELTLTSSSGDKETMEYDIDGDTLYLIAEDEGTKLIFEK